MQIKFKDVTKEYEGSLKALDKVSFEVDRGEFIFIVGESGAGKSTLIKLLIREELPSTGMITVDKDDVSMLQGDGIAALSTLK